LVSDERYISNFINIANAYINLSFWPSHFKQSTSIIIPKPNKPAYNLPKAFHLIVLLNILKKLIEKVIGKRLQTQYLASNFIYPSQLGSLKHHSSLNANLYLTHLIYAKWVKSLSTNTLAFNITQFFSSLNHCLLLLIFNKAGFDLRISSFFSNYLINSKTQYIWSNFAFFFQS